MNSNNNSVRSSIYLGTSNLGLRLLKLLDVTGSSRLSTGDYTARVDGLEIEKTTRETLLKDLTRKTPPNHYSTFFMERQSWLEANASRALVITGKTRSRLVTGLSYGIAQLSGCTLHHTFGVPCLSGSQVKGACRSAAFPPESGQDAGESAEQQAAGKHSARYSIYGDPSTGAGWVTFLEALPDPRAKSPFLELDILTPHHSKYYGEDPDYSDAPDIENPVPVAFLAVRPDVPFHFAFIFRNKKERNQWGDTVRQHLLEANETGLGAKGSSGYGWFEF